MRRPEWAAAGTFPEAWRAASIYATQSSLDWMRSHCTAVVRGMGLAHVITVPEEQVRALPLEYDDYLSSAAAFLNTKLPFDPVYLSVGRAPLGRFSPPGHLLGALVGRPGDKADGWDGVQPIIFPCVEIPGPRRVVTWESSVFATPDGWAGWSLSEYLARKEPERAREMGITEEAEHHAATLKADAAEIIATVLYFLESANVELVDATPSRQERRQVERKGGRIALTVQIRAPKKRPRSDAPVEHPDWTHRWEVRGHYKHFPVGTRLADSRPDRLVTHATLGQCRRIWCPPHVKGPQDKPLVPKLRVVV